MLIVPADSHLEVEAMVSNRDIGFVHAGEPAEIKIDTFNFTRYGLLHGEVLNVSHDAIVREKPADKAATPASGALANRASRRARSCSTPRACRSTAGRWRSTTGWSISRPAWR